MNMEYFVVKPLINGFECVFFAYGTTDSVKDYMEKVLQAPFTMIKVNEELAQQLFRVGFKIYMCPLVSDSNSIPTQPEEEELTVNPETEF